VVNEAPLNKLAPVPIATCPGGPNKALPSDFIPLTIEEPRVCGGAADGGAVVGGGLFPPGIIPLILSIVP